MSSASRLNSILSFVPRVLRPQNTDLTGGVLWGTAAVTGALFVVQPFSWIKEQFTAPPPEEEEEKK